MKKFSVFFSICLFIQGCSVTDCERAGSSGIEDEPTQCLDCDYACYTQCVNDCDKTIVTSMSCTDDCKDQCCSGIGEK